MDPPPEAFEKFDQLPEEWQDWWDNEYDPRCDAICRAIYGEDECG